MSSCNFIRQILPTECIGDSLATINSNFSALDVNLCATTKPVPGLGTELKFNSSEQFRNTFSFSTKNSFQYVTEFESIKMASLSGAILADGTVVKSVKFPYLDSISDYKPEVTFTTPALTNTAPKVTLCWMASGSDSTTVYALNSATDNVLRGPIWPNGSVNAFSLSGDRLYMGGDFTTVGGSMIRKFCEIDLKGGDLHPFLYNAGSVASTPFVTLGDLGPHGSVDAIEHDSRFLIVGGSFHGGDKGRGLCILDKQTNSYYPFYVNGEVKTLKIVGDKVLYVGGNFNYVNYGPTSATEFSNLRVQTNGLFGINLALLLQNPFGSFYSISLFSGPAIVNTIEAYDQFAFIGGEFVVKDNERLVTQNLCVCDVNTEQQVIDWLPIVDGPVHSLAIDNTIPDGGNVYLYIGGKFSKIYSEPQFNATPRIDGEEVMWSNVAAFKIDEDMQISPMSYWKPKFNGPVFKFLFENFDTDSNVYCYGHFTTVNNKQQNYLACVRKASYLFEVSSGELIQWNPSIQKAPLPHNKAFELYENSVLVGGVFSKAEKSYRYNLARISNADVSPSLSSVNWDFGCQLVSPGMEYTFDFTELERVSASPASFGTINYTNLPVNEETFSGNIEGQNIRFYLRRAGNSLPFGNLGSITDQFRKTVDVLGVKIDYNQ